MPFRNSKTLKIETVYGSYLGRNEGCLARAKADLNVQRTVGRFG